MIWTALAFSLVTNQNFDTNQLNNYMNNIAPHVGKNRIAYVAKIIQLKSEKYQLNPYIFATIVKQESNFKSDTVSCTDISCDYGLAQINDVNVERYHLDRDKLVHDDNYNLEVAAKILFQLKKDFPDEINFFSRFHDGRPKERAKYEACLNAWISRSNYEPSRDNPQRFTN